MKKYIIILLSLVSANVSAHISLKDAFRAMPDSLLPYITKNNRLDCIDFIESKMKAEVKNEFDLNSEMTQITDDYLFMKLSGSSSVEMRMLDKTNDTTGVICVVRTYLAPAAESKIEFYTDKWVRLKTDDFVKAPKFDLFFKKPDSMVTDEFERLKKSVYPVMIEAKMSKDDNTMKYCLSLPLVNKDETKVLESIISPITLKWDGETFK